jgi:hypothetical protein
LSRRRSYILARLSCALLKRAGGREGLTEPPLTVPEILGRLSAGAVKRLHALAAQTIPEKEISRDRS